MNRSSIKPFNSKVSIGLKIGYTDKLIDRSKIIKSIQQYQNQLIATKGIYLSVSLTECVIVLSGQAEPHLQLNFINYPKFPNDEAVLKKEIEDMTRFLMDEYQQNRVIIEFPGETLMLEKSIEVDPRIN